MGNKIKTNSPIYKQIGNRLKNIRIQKGVSQQAIANYLKVDRTTYANYEMGNSTMNYERLLKIADYFSVDFNTLLCYDFYTPLKGVNNFGIIPCMPKDTIYVIDCLDKESNEYIIQELTIYAVIVKENKILLTCNGSGYYQWTLNEDAFLNFEDAQQKLNALKKE